MRDTAINARRNAIRHLVKERLEAIVDGAKKSTEYWSKAKLGAEHAKWCTGFEDAIRAVHTSVVDAVVLVVDQTDSSINEELQAEVRRLSALLRQSEERVQKLRQIPEPAIEEAY